MSGEKFNLAWRDFEFSVSQTVRDLLSDTDFTDVTLASHDEEQIKAHKFMLCSASPFFRRILLKNPHQNPLLFLKNVNIKTLQSIINFIYLGQTEIEQDELEEFLATAKELEIKGLSTETLEQQTQTKNTKEQFSLPFEEDGYTHFNEEVKQSFNADQITTEHDEDDLDDPLNHKPISLGSESLLSSSTKSDSTGRYPCSKCNHTAINQSALKVHIDGIHEGVRYPCEYCDYKATQKSTLNRHRKKHTQ